LSRAGGKGRDECPRSSQTETDAVPAQLRRFSRLPLPFRMIGTTGDGRPYHLPSRPEVAFHLARFAPQKFSKVGTLYATGSGVRLAWLLRRAVVRWGSLGRAKTKMSPYIFFRYAQVGGRNLLADGGARDSVVLTPRERRRAEEGAPAAFKAAAGLRGHWVRTSMGTLERVKALSGDKSHISHSLRTLETRRREDGSSSAARRVAGQSISISRQQGAKKPQKFKSSCD